MDFMLPPSPNWNCSKILDSDESGFLCFASRSGVYALDLSAYKNSSPSLLFSHQGRVNGLSMIFCKNFQGLGDARIICSGASDGSVKVVQVSSVKDCRILAEHKHHKFGITAVDCSCINELLVVSADEKGSLCIWNARTNEYIWRANHSDGAIISLAFSPENHEVIAAGLEVGTVLILRIVKKSVEVEHKLREHCNKVTSLHWLKKTSGGGRKSCLLFSGQDRTVKLWEVGGDRSMRVFPHPSGPKKGREVDHATRGWWFTFGSCSWSESSFLSTGINGELMLWTLDGSKVVALPGCGRDPRRIVFNVATWMTSDGVKMAAAVSSDRMITVWNVDEGKVSFGLPTLGGFVYSIDQSPVSSGTFAIGVGDKTIKLFTKSSRVCSNFSAHPVKFRVTALSWHPFLETTLAFGTEEGTVAIVKDVSMAKMDKIEVCRTFHKKTVHSVSWGHMIGGKFMGNTYLYSVGSMTCHVHDPKCTYAPAKNLEEIVCKLDEHHEPGNVSELSFSPDRNLVAVGYDDGTIIVREVGNGSPICKVICCKRTINSISWHPSSALLPSSSSSPFRNWIAVASNSSSVEVFDVSKFVGESKSDRSTYVLNEAMATLQGHILKVTKVAWSPGGEGLLASASFDGTVQIWNVEEGLGMANYRGHAGSVLCLVWDADGETLYSGGDDFTLQGWKFRDLPDDLPPKERRAKIRIPPGKSTACPQDGCSEEVHEFVGAASDEGRIDAKDSPGLPREGEKKEGIPLESVGVLTSQKDKREKRKLRSLFPTSSSMEKELHQEQQDCVKLASILYSGTPRADIRLDGTSTHLGFFVNRRTADQLVEQEALYHESQEGHETERTILEVIRGGDFRHLRELAKKRLLDDYLVSMAYSVSPEYMEEMYVAYAGQLLEERKFLKAASYLLVIGKTSEALDLLLENKLHREAVCLVGSRLNPLDPLFRKCYRSAGEAYARHGKFELAAKCFLAIGRQKEATSLIARRGTPGSLGVAALVAMETGDDDLKATYACGRVVELMLAQDWPAVKGFLGSMTGMEHLELLSSCHETLLSALSSAVPEATGEVDANRLHSRPGRSRSLAIDSLESCLGTWRAKGRRVGRREVKAVREGLLVVLRSRQPNHDVQNTLVDVSLYISLFVSGHLAGEADECDVDCKDEPNAWLLEAMDKLESIREKELLTPLRFHTCRVLFPDGNCDLNTLSRSLQKTYQDYTEQDSTLGKHPEDTGADSSPNVFEVDEVISLLEAFSTPTDQNDPEGPATRADCVRARCCLHALEMLLDLLQREEPERPKEGAGDSNFGSIGLNVDLRPLLSRACSVLLRKGPAEVAVASRNLTDIDGLCRELVLRGGCGGIRSSQGTQQDERERGGGDADATGCPPGPGERSEDFVAPSRGVLGLDPEDLTMPVLAGLLERQRKILASYPAFYTKFPDFHKSIQVMKEISRFEKFASTGEFSELLQVMEEFVNSVNAPLQMQKCG